MAAPTVQDQSRSSRPRTGGTALQRWLRCMRESETEAGVRRKNLLRFDEVRGVLERARDTVASGWVQDRWYVLPARPGAGLAGLLRPTTIGPRDVTGACVVGAVALAAQRQDACRDLVIQTGPALDYVWDALQETRGRGGLGVAGRAAPREVRLARMRDITHWNDQSCRTRDEVLAVLDLAVSRVIMSAMAQPAPAPPSPGSGRRL